MSSVEWRQAKKNMKRKITVLALCAMLFALSFPAEAQQPKKVPRIGYLLNTDPATESTRFEGVRLALRELGYIEGQNIAIEYRYAEGKPDRFPELAAELVRLKVEILVSGGPIPTRAAKEANVTIPIVMTQDTDPVGNGFVASLARPGGNITGLSTLAPELSGKRLELLNEIIPKLSRVAVFGTSTMPGHARSLREIELAAGAFKVQVQHLDILGPKDIEIGFRAASKERADAVLTLNSPYLQFSFSRDCRTRGKEPAPYHVQQARLCGSWGTYDLRRKPPRLGSARRYVRGQDIERRQTR